MVRGGRERRYRIFPEQEVMGRAVRQAQDLWPVSLMTARIVMPVAGGHDACTAAVAVGTFGPVPAYPCGPTVQKSPTDLRDHPAGTGPARRTPRGRASTSPTLTLEVTMNRPRLSLLLGSVLAVPMALVVSAAGPAAADPPSTTFGSHVSSCAQMSTGFSGQHNPSHHRGPAAAPMSGMYC